MKVFEAKERARRYLRECLLGWFKAPGSSAAAGLGSESRRGEGRTLGLLLAQDLYALKCPIQPLNRTQRILPVQQALWVKRTAGLFSLFF